MITTGNIYSTAPSAPLAASPFMSDSEDPASSPGIKDQWQNPAGEGEHVLFKPDELDIYVNKVTLEAYIFYGKTIEHNDIDHLEYHPDDYTVDVVFENGQHIDLGVKIQWLVRPYLSKADQISFVQTKDGEAVDGKMVPIVHKKKKDKDKTL